MQAEISPIVKFFILHPNYVRMHLRTLSIVFIIQVIDDLLSVNKLCHTAFGWAQAKLCGYICEK